MTKELKDKIFMALEDYSKSCTPIIKDIIEIMHINGGLTWTPTDSICDQTLYNAETQFLSRDTTIIFRVFHDKFNHLEIKNDAFKEQTKNGKDCFYLLFSKLDLY